MTTVYYLDPEDIVSDFLRTYLTDPRDRAEDSNTDNVTATAGQTEITLTPSANTTVSCITALTVNGTSLNKWEDYYWDYQNEKVTFFTALTLNDTVVITFKEGSKNWIYSDKTDDNLGANSFPRISMFMVVNPGKRLGQYKAPMESSSIMQIDVWSKDRYIAEISGRKYSNNYLTRYLGNQITKAFEDNESALFPVLYNYRLVSGPRAASYSDQYQAYHSIVEINVKGLRTGRIEVI